MNARLRLLILALALGQTLAFADQPQPSFPGAEGFGAQTKGGAGGRQLVVTRLDDDPRKPAEGSLRWAVQKKGARKVTFAVSGDIRLQGTLSIRHPFLTVDGSSTPGMGVCLRGGSVEIKDTQDIILRHLRIRLGDETVLRKNKDKSRKRPADSDGLDCVSMMNSLNIMLDHCSLSWSCDELIGITHCRNVTVQWCLLSEPLANPKLHPYGNAHAFAVNASASTLSIHHCLFAHFAMRGPQFECNDLNRRDAFTVQMEAVNNLVFDYDRSGSRYTTGIENGEGVSKGKSYEFQFLNNLYVNNDRSTPPIEPVLRLGHLDALQVHEFGNLKTRRLGKYPVNIAFAESLDATSRGQLRMEKLFTAPVPVSMESTPVAAERILNEVGCALHRDATDERLISEVRRGQHRSLVKSQDEVGGWPTLK